MNTLIKTLALVLCSTALTASGQTTATTTQTLPHGQEIQSDIYAQLNTANAALLDLDGRAKPAYAFYNGGLSSLQCKNFPSHKACQKWLDDNKNLSGDCNPGECR